MLHRSNQELVHHGWKGLQLVDRIYASWRVQQEHSAKTGLEFVSLASTLTAPLTAHYPSMPADDPLTRELMAGIRSTTRIHFDSALKGDGALRALREWCRCGKVAAKVVRE